jgi:hypothetical protein
MNDIEFNLKKDFSECPGARYKNTGMYSGEELRDTYLAPLVKKAIDNKIHLIINLDGTAGCAASFLEETFGGMIRNNIADYSDLMNTLVFISNECPKYINEIKSYMKDAAENKHFHFRRFLDFVVYKDKTTGEFVHYTREQKNKIAEQHDRMQQFRKE